MAEISAGEYFLCSVKKIESFVVLRATPLFLLLQRLEQVKNSSCYDEQHTYHHRNNGIRLIVRKGSY